MLSKREKDLLQFTVYMLRNNNDGRCISNVLRERLSAEDRKEVQTLLAQPHNGAPT